MIGAIYSIVSLMIRLVCNYVIGISQSYKEVERYFKPVSQAIVTTVELVGSFAAIWMAAATFMPEDVPAKIPSFLANSFA